MSISIQKLIFTVLLIPGQVRIRGDDDPGLVYVPVGPTSDFRMKNIPDQPVDANNASSSSTASPFGKNMSTFKHFTIFEELQFLLNQK